MARFVSATRAVKLKPGMEQCARYQTPLGSCYRYSGETRRGEWCKIIALAGRKMVSTKSLQLLGVVGSRGTAGGCTLYPRKKPKLQPHKHQTPSSRQPPRGLGHSPQLSLRRKALARRWLRLKIAHHAVASRLWLVKSVTGLCAGRRPDWRLASIGLRPLDRSLKARRQSCDLHA